MNSEGMLFDRAVESGWNTSTMLTIACRFIDSLGEEESVAFEIFIENQIQEEKEMDIM